MNHYFLEICEKSMKNKQQRSIYSEYKDHQITCEDVFWSRRDVIKRLAMTGIGASVAGSSFLYSSEKVNSLFLTDETLSSEFVVTNHNNFYEFSTSKSKPANLAKNFNPGLDWKVKISGAVENPGYYTLDDILKWSNIEERIYRLRCVEAWSMVIPWTGFQLSHLINRIKPTSKAKFVEVKTLKSASIFPRQKRDRKSVV